MRFDPVFFQYFGRVFRKHVYDILFSASVSKWAPQVYVQQQEPAGDQLSLDTDLSSALQSQSGERFTAYRPPPSTNTQFNGLRCRRQSTGVANGQKERQAGTQPDQY